MAYDPNRGPGDPRRPAERQAAGAGNTKIILIILAIVALFLAVMFLRGGAEQAVVPDATLPTASQPQAAPLQSTTGSPAATPSAPDATPSSPSPATGAAPNTTAPAN